MAVEIELFQPPSAADELNGTKQWLTDSGLY